MECNTTSDIETSTSSPPTPCLTPTGGDCHKDADLPATAVEEPESDSAAIITTPDLYPFKLCRDLVELKGEEGYESLFGLVAISAVVTILQAVTYGTALASLADVTADQCKDLVGSTWDTPTAFGAALAVVYVATKVAAQFYIVGKVDGEVRRLLTSILPLHWIYLLVTVNALQFLVVVFSLYVFSTVIAQATELVGLISNFIGLGIVSEVGSLMGGFLKVIDKRPEEFRVEGSPVAPRKALTQLFTVVVCSAMVYGLVKVAILMDNDSCSMHETIWWDSNTDNNFKYDVFLGSTESNIELTAAYQLGAFQSIVLNSTVNTTTTMNIDTTGIIDFRRVSLDLLNMASRDVYRVQDIGFHFPFFNEEMTSLTIDSTGVIRFDHGSIAPNAALAQYWAFPKEDNEYGLGPIAGASTSSPPLIALFWTADFDFSSGGNVYAGPVTNTSYAIVLDQVSLVGYNEDNSVAEGYVTAEVLLDQCGSITMTWYTDTVMPTNLQSPIHIGISSGDTLADKAGLVYAATDDPAFFDSEITGSILVAKPQNGACSSITNEDSLTTLKPSERRGGIYIPTAGVTFETEYAY